ncbi:semialdehyde dehydrogenase [Salmonella enterica subsp. enterica serovar Typhi]|nr:semialdehyde dehydrogenase [Salmonella enterica subsp. enterica serovar Typhi]
MSEGWNIAILGATGAVGEALLETLAERQFPVGEIYALARHESAGEHLRFGGKSVIVQDAADFDWTQAQLAFFVAGAEASAAWIDDATNAGCLVIDSSGLFALEPDVPLVVPEVNPYVLADYRNRNVIAVADSLTSQLLAALKPLIDQGGLSRIAVTSMLSASAQGKKRSMRWPDKVRSCLTAYRLMKMISLAASWRSICCRCCRIGKAACARNVVSSMKCVKFCRMMA